MRAATPILLLLISCGGSAPATPATPAAPAASAGGENTAPAAIAPRPFTAEQIRAAMPAGTQITFHMEESGKPPVVLHWRVTAADEATMTLVSSVVGINGNVIAEEPAQSTPWQELAEHSSFPAARTARSEGSVQVPAGRFDTIDYVVTDEQDGSKTVSTFRFAKQLPGPPVLLTVEKDGVTVRRMTLIQRSSAPASAPAP
jgi:hypothetical protein